MFVFSSCIILWAIVLLPCFFLLSMINLLFTKKSNVTSIEHRNPSSLRDRPFELD